MKSSTLVTRPTAWDRRSMTRYTRYQLIVLLVLLGAAGPGPAAGTRSRGCVRSSPRPRRLGTPAMSRLAIPAAPVAIAFASGIALAPWARADVAWTTWLASLASAGALLLAGRTSWAAALLLAGVGAIGALRGIEPPLPPDHVARLELPRIARVDGRLAAEPVRWTPDRLRLLIDVEGVDGLPRSGRIQATVYGVPPPLAEGQRLAPPLRPYPATGPRKPGTFDSAEHLKREGIRVTATAHADRLTPLDDPA